MSSDQSSDLAVATSSSFAKGFGRYLLLAQKRPVQVTSHGHVVGVFVSQERFLAGEEALARAGRALAVSELDWPAIERIAAGRMDAKHADLNALLD